MVTALLLAAVAVAVWPTAGPSDATEPRVFAELRARRRRRRAAPVAQESVATSAEMLAMCLTAGLTPTRAMEVLAGRAELHEADPGVRRAVAAVTEATRHGRPAGHLWAEHAPEVAGIPLLGAAWQLSETSGMSLAPALAATAAALREDRAAQQRISAEAAGARTTMWLLTLLPVAGPLAATLFGLTPTEVILGNPIAAASTVVGIALTVAGWRLSHRLLTRALKPPEVS